ncbi:MAG TPA: C-terminal binding protein [Clostridia bacterium]|nr:C-terminal binding protein [Clostridia bacterium]
MSNFKVLMTDSIFPDQEKERAMLEEIGAELLLSDSQDPAQLAKLAKDCDAIIVTFAEVTREVISACEKCKVIVRTGIGVNNVDVKAATEKGIIVANVLNYCIPEVADHAMALMLASLRKIIVYNKVVRCGVWDMNQGSISRIGSLTLGLYGFGNISREVALRAKAFGMKVVAYDPFLEDSIFEEYGIERKVDLEEFIQSADVLSLHLGLNEHTYQIINKKTFELMKESAILVNVSRGGLVNEDDLLYAIENNLIAGCALDVMADEPGDMHSRLLTYKNVIVTPHAAFYSEESNEELRTKATEQVLQTLTKGYPEFWVNKKELETKGERK